MSEMATNADRITSSIEDITVERPGSSGETEGMESSGELPLENK